MDKQGFVDGRQGASGVQRWNIAKGEMVDTGEPELKQLVRFLLQAGHNDKVSSEMY